MTKTTDPTPRTSNGLRDLLFDAIERVMDGSMEPKAAGAIAGLADRVIASARLDADLALALEDLRSGDNAPKVIGFSDG